MKKRNKLSLTTKYVVFLCALIMIANVVLGAVLVQQSKNMLRSLIRSHMIEIAKTAAALIDGDALALLDEENVGTPAFEEAYDEVRETLLAFMENNDVKFVYALRSTRPEDHKDYPFEFTVDPDPDDPAAFGDEVVYTEGTINASKGVPTVDEEPAEDQWGNFYSAWAPVYKSGPMTPENIAGIVGVDFGADWYEDQISRHSVSVTVISIVSVLACACIALILAGRLRRRLKSVQKELTVLSSDVEELFEEIASSPGFTDHAELKQILTAEEDGKESEKGGVLSELGRKLDADGETGDMLEVLGEKLKSVQKELRLYIDYVHAQAYSDSMTGVCNKTAYLEKIQDIEKIIGTEQVFSIVVFDVNGLKNVNDNYGHETGDMLITDAATVLKRIFDANNVYRIGGDEFIVILQGSDARQTAELMADLDVEIEMFNRDERHYEPVLAMSKGAATCERGDESYKAVFKRADEEMYKDKAAFYLRTGDRRKRR